MGDGANPYTEGQLFDWLRRTFVGDQGAVQGPLRGVRAELVVTAGSGKVTVGTGAAYVYGIPYENTETLEIPIPTPTTAPRQDRIVLRADWSTNTVRAGRRNGVEGGGPPAITQTWGVAYEVSLAIVQVTVAGAITVVDERQYARFATEVATENIANGAVTAEKLSGGAVGTAMIADGAVTAAKLADGPGSGVDADLLDGKHASAFMPIAALNDLKQSKSIYNAGSWSFGESWADIANMSLSVSLSGTCDLYIVATVQEDGAGGSLHISAQVDTTALNDYTSKYTTTDTFHWYFGSVGSGSHSIKLRGRSDVSGKYLTGRRLSVIVIPRS